MSLSFTRTAQCESVSKHNLYTTVVLSQGPLPPTHFVSRIRSPIFLLSLSLPPRVTRSFTPSLPHLTPSPLPGIDCAPDRSTYGMSSMFGGGAREPPSPLPSELDCSVARLGLGLSTSTSMLRLACAVAIDSTPRTTPLSVSNIWTP